MPVQGQMAVSTEPAARGRSFSQEKRPESLLQTQEAPVAATEADEFPEIVVMSKRRSISVGGRGKQEAAAAAAKTEESMTDSSLASLDDSTNGFGDSSLGPGAFNMKVETGELVPSPTLMDKLEGRISRISPVKIVKPTPPSDYSLPSDAPQWVEDVFAKYVKGNNMWKNPMTDRIDPEVWNVIQDNKKLKIMQSYRKTNVFRCLYVLDGNASSEKMLQVI